MKQKRLQILTPDGWQWVFAWADGCRIATTENPAIAIKDEGDNVAYFQGKTARPIRAIAP